MGQMFQLRRTPEKVDTVCDIYVQQKIQQNQIKHMVYMTNGLKLGQIATNHVEHGINETCVGLKIW